MEDAIGLASLTHELIETFVGAGKHVREIRRGEAHAFGFAGSARGVDDRADVVGFAEIASVRNRLRRHGLPQDFIEQYAARRVRGVARPSLCCGVSEGGVAHQEQLGLRIVHHSREFSRRLAIVKWHDNHAFGHQREIERRPANGVGSEKRATITGLKACATKISAHLPNLLQELFAGNANELLAVNLAENDTAGAALELSKYSFEKIRHGSLASACQIKDNPHSN